MGDAEFKIGDSVILNGSIQEIIVDKDGTRYKVDVAGGEFLNHIVILKTGYLQKKGE